MSLNDIYNVLLWRKATDSLRSARNESNDGNRFANATLRNRQLKAELQDAEIQVATLMAHEERIDSNISHNKKVIKEAEEKLADFEENSLTLVVLEKFSIHKVNKKKCEDLLLEIAAFEALIEESKKPD